MTTVATNFSGGASILGDTSGNAIAAGYVGEIVTGSITSPGVLSNSTITITEATGELSLPSGKWLIVYGGLPRHDGKHNSTLDYQQSVKFELYVRYASANITGSGIGYNSIVPYTPSLGGNAITVSKCFTYSHSDSSNRSLKIGYLASGDGSVTVVYRSLSDLFIYAVRIA